MTPQNPKGVSTSFLLKKAITRNDADETLFWAKQTILDGVAANKIHEMAITSRNIGVVSAVLENFNSPIQISCAMRHACKAPPEIFAAYLSMVFDNTQTMSFLNEIVAGDEHENIDILFSGKGIPRQDVIAPFLVPAWRKQDKGMFKKLLSFYSAADILPIVKQEQISDGAGMIAFIEKTILTQKNPTSTTLSSRKSP